MEVARGIHRLEASLGETYVCIYLLVGEQAAAVVDTGIDSSVAGVLTPYLDSIGLARRRVRYVLNTHADMDHTGGNAALRAELPEAVFMCHLLDRAWVEDLERMIQERYLEFRDGHGVQDPDEVIEWYRANARHVPVDLALSGGERLRLDPGWEVELMHTPGHSWGHMSVYDRRSRALIIEDAVLGSAVPYPDGRPSAPPSYRYLDTYLTTIQRLQSLDVDILLTGHFPVMRGPAAAQFLAESRAFCERYETELGEYLQSTPEPRSLRQAIDHLSPRLGGWPQEARDQMSYSLLGHLESLEQRRLVERQEQDGRTVYSWRRRT
jgi:glyoxylase-like metal-dependent hydrolase (beta-lactamase superfamily II)